MKFISDEVVIVSDIHIRHEDDSRAHLLYDLCKRINTEKVEYFILLGDIFDFCFGSSDYFKRKFHRLGSLLEQLSRQGVKVLFFQGNHEFSLEDLKWQGVDFITSIDHQVSLKNKVELLLSHGDRIKSPWHYKIYLSFTRSTVFKMAGLLVPQRILDRFCLNLSKKSREVSSKKQVFLDEILENLGRWIECSSAAHGVVGHFHIPFVKKDSKNRKILCLHSWDKPNVLTFDGTNFSRFYFKKIGQPFVKKTIIK